MTSVTKAELPAFKKAYNEAVKNGLVTFTYKGAVVLVSYAKYVIEFLEGKP
jgi:hypothetical protein